MKRYRNQPNQTSLFTKDPTENVRELFALYMERADKLNEAEQHRVNEMMTTQIQHAEALRVAEAKRIDAIRAVDVGAVSVANERATAQAAVLANQLNQMNLQLLDRIALVERAQYESRGTGAGMRDMWAWIFGGIMGIIAIISLLFSILRH